MSPANVIASQKDLNVNGSYKKFRHTATKIDSCGTSQVTSLLSRSYQGHIKWIVVCLVSIYLALMDIYGKCCSTD